MCSARPVTGTLACTRRTSATRCVPEPVVPAPEHREHLSARLVVARRTRCTLAAVSVLATAWLGSAWLRRRLARPAAEDRTESWHRFIREHAPGRSFADIGGLYAIHGENALLAEEVGASQVTLFDAGEPTPKFLEKCRERNCSIRFVQGDVEDPVSIREIGPHDIVWCTGVIYHTPNPVVQLMHLREITRELLFLGTATIPEIPGIHQACIYYPYLEYEQRREYARGLPNPSSSLAVGAPFDDRPMYGHGNFWWGITPSALRAMLATARFEILEERRSSFYPWIMDVVARPEPKHPSLPPVGYYRERGERRKRGDPLPPFHGYYEKGPDAVATADDVFPHVGDALPRDDPGSQRLRRLAGRILRLATKRGASAP